MQKSSFMHVTYTNQYHYEALHYYHNYLFKFKGKGCDEVIYNRLVKSVQHFFVQY